MIGRLISFTPGEVDVYEGYATQMLSGLKPYVDYWFEYPPGLLPIAAIPKLLSSLTGSYFVLWVALVASLVAATAMLIVRHQARQKLPSELIKMPQDDIQSVETQGLRQTVIIGRPVGVFAFLALIMAGGIFSIYRYDVVVACIVVWAIVAFRERRFELSVAVMVYAAFTKLYPALFIPLMFVHSPFKRWPAMLATLLVVSGLFFNVWTQSGFLRFLEFHGDKPVQIESIQGMYHREKPIVYDRFSYVYEGAKTIAVYQYGIVALALAYVVLKRKFFTFEMGSTVLLSAFLIGGNIFSPQYMLWFASFVPFISGYYAMHLIGITWLTQFYFKYYEAITQKLEPETLLLTARNVWLIGLFVKMITDEFVALTSSKNPS